MAWKDKDGGKEPPFCKMYKNTFHMYLNMTHQEILIVTYLASMMRYDNSIVLTSIEKKKLINSLGTTDGNFRYCVSSLLKKGILFKGSGRGAYVLNPTFMFKGTVEQRKACIEELGLDE